MIENLNNIENKHLLTIDELAKFFSVSKPTIYRLVDKREINFYKIGGGLRFRREDIESYLNDVQVEKISK